MSQKLLALSLALLPLAAALALAPAASALHICQPNEPPWSCEHRRPTPGEVVRYLCDRLPLPPSLRALCDLIPALLPVEVSTLA